MTKGLGVENNSSVAIVVTIISRLTDHTSRASLFSVVSGLI